MTDKKTTKKLHGAAAKGPGPGRPKNCPNKVTKTLKEAILAAGEEAGGSGGLQAYLLRQARKRNNAPFMALLGRVLPMTVQGPDGGPQEHTVTLVIKGVKPSE